MLFPLCGIDYEHLELVKGMNKRQAAKKLGISEDFFYSTIKREGLGWMFPHTKNRKLCVTKEEIVELAQQGFIRSDVAYMLGISRSYLKDLIKRFDIADKFTVSWGKAAWVARRGYADQS